MILRMKETPSGTLVPLDVFDDFKVSYNHAFEDSKSLSGKKIPYTSSFKIPLTDRNRALCGIPFDITFPRSYEVEGDVVTDEGELMFTAIYEIQSIRVNVLQPYISINMIDHLSYAIRELGKTDLSELMTGEGTTFQLDNEWLYNAPNDVEYPLTAPFVFPFINWNNKNATFGYDPKRDLNQLQPVFIVKHLIKQIFAHVGVDINSKFLFDDNEIATGILSEELGLMIPTKFIGEQTGAFTTQMILKEGRSDIGLLDKDLRQLNVPSAMGTSSRILTPDFRGLVDSTNGLKMNWEEYKDWQDLSEVAHNSSEICSMVDGKLTITTTSKTTTNPLRYYIGALTDSGNNNVYKPVSVDSGSFPDLDVYLVLTGGFEFKEDPLQELDRTAEAQTTSTYDLKSSKKIGTATYHDIMSYRDISDVGSIYKAFTWNITFLDGVENEFEVEANQKLEFALAFAAPEGSPISETCVFENVNSQEWGTCTIEIKEGFIEYKDIVSNDPDTYSRYHVGTKFGDQQHLDMQFAFMDGETEFPPMTEHEYENAVVPIPQGDISLEKSYEFYNTKYKLIDIVKMVMERFNLNLFSRPDGTIHIDNAQNRSVGEMQIEHLIDEGIDVEYTYNELGILTMRDSNPSFYIDGFNELDKYEVSETKKEETSIEFKTAIIAEDMFAEGYNDEAFDLLKYHNDSNYWGTSDRVQAALTELKPTFVFLDTPTEDKKVFFPINVSSNKEKIFFPEDEDDTIGTSEIGFYNYFIHAPAAPRLHGSEAVQTKNGYSLKSFTDNFIDVGNTVYNNEWKSRVRGLMDNDVTSISVSIYLSPSDFIKLSQFPIINYYGAEWTMTGFQKYPLSSRNGGIVNLDLTLIEYDPDAPFATAPVITLT